MRLRPLVLAALPLLLVAAPEAGAASKRKAAKAAEAPAAEPAAAVPGEVFAVIGDVPVTRTEVDARAAAALRPVREQEYEVRRQALEKLVDERLVAAAAEREGVTPDQWLARQYETRPGTPAERRAAVLAELRAATGVKILLEPPRIAIPATDAPSRGPADAPVTIVMFSDYQCGYCSRVEPTLKQVRETYGDRVRLVFRDFPLAMHRQAQKAAEAAGCAGEQGKFWEMHDALFAQQQALGVPDLKRYAASLNLDQAMFDACLDSGRRAAAVKKDLEDGTSYGVRGTPAFFINGRFLNGAKPFEAFAQVIDQELARTAATSAASDRPAPAAQPAK